MEIEKLATLVQDIKGHHDYCGAGSEIIGTKTRVAFLSFQSSLGKPQARYETVQLAAPAWHTVHDAVVLDNCVVFAPIGWSIRLMRALVRWPLSSDRLSEFFVLESHGNTGTILIG